MKNEVLDQWVDFGKNASEPLLRLNEITGRAIEQVARHQWELARDYIDLGTRQMELLGSARDPQKWLTEQNAVASEFGKKLMNRGQEFIAVATELQKSVVDWAEKAAKKAPTVPTAKAEAA